MPEYLTPGVYVEEFEIGAKPIERVSTCTAGFLGETERGPTKPTLVTSWPGYQRLFGGAFEDTQYLPYAVQGFFLNGGKRCFIARITDTEGSRLAQLDIGTIRVKAVSPGTWGNQVAITISEGLSEGFRLTVYYWNTLSDLMYDPRHPDNAKKNPQPAIIEEFDNLTLVEDSPNHFANRVNDGRSSLIELQKIGNSNEIPKSQNIQFLQNGLDGGPITLGDYEGCDEIGKRTGLNAFNEHEYRDISIVYAPNVSEIDAVTGRLITHCEQHKDRFAILDSKQAQSDITNLNPRSERSSKYAAFYYPWIRIVDSQTGKQKLVPPGGHIAGIYARTDLERGVFKAPANEVVRGAVELEFQINDEEQAVLNPIGVNCLRSFPGRGNRVWGARTLARDPLWKYINVTRLFIFLEASIIRGTQWVVFEPNNERLWARVRSSIEQFLLSTWRSGAFMGRRQEEAFFVNVDRSTMTQDDIDNGRLIVMIGIAPTKPAEFVVFRITQFTADAKR